MNYRKIINVILLCMGVCFIVISRLVEMPLLGWAGDISLISGAIMLPKTAFMDRKK